MAVSSLVAPGAFDIISTLGTRDTARVVAQGAAAKLGATPDSLQGWRVVGHGCGPTGADATSNA
jgi:hypothetical protein